MTKYVARSLRWESVPLGLLLFSLTACAPQEQTWHDFTNNQRGITDLKMDVAACQQVSQNVPAATSEGYCPSCASINMLTTSINKDNAYNNCMQAHGWEQIGATAQSQAQVPPLAPASSEQREMFRSTSTKNTRVFIFAFYDSFADEAWFGTSYRVDINGHYAGKFSNSQYIELDIPPGKYAFDIYDYGWLGTPLHHAGSNIQIGQPGQPIFLAIDSYSQGISFSVANEDFGMKTVVARDKIEAAKLTQF